MSMYFLFFTLLYVSACSAAIRDQKMYQFFRCTSNSALAIGNALIKQKRISSNNSIYRAYEKLIPILSFKEKPSDNVLKIVNTVFNTLLEQKYSTSPAMHINISQKTHVFTSATKHLYTYTQLKIPHNTPRNIQEFEKLVIQTYLDNKDITSETERDAFIALILLGIKMNLLLNSESII